MTPSSRKGNWQHKFTWSNLCCSILTISLMVEGLDRWLLTRGCDCTYPMLHNVRHSFFSLLIEFSTLGYSAPPMIANKSQSLHSVVRGSIKTHESNEYLHTEFTLSADTLTSCKLFTIYEYHSTFINRPLQSQLYSQPVVIYTHPQSHTLHAISFRVVSRMEWVVVIQNSLGIGPELRTTSKY